MYTRLSASRPGDAGSASRTHLGVVIFSGVAISTAFTLFVVPAFYSLFARRTGSPGAVAARLARMQGQEAG